MPQLKLATTIRAPADQVWATILRAEDFPVLVDDVVDVVLDPGSSADVRISRWAVRLEGAVLEWTQQEQLDEERRLLAFEQVEGDLSVLVGTWTVTDLASAGSRIDLDVMFEIGIPLLADIINPVAVRALRENFQQLLEKIDEFCGNERG
jgi:ribosome-associated toxin RatA of RatAB toxin-antitoxin module